jgi:protein-disulfide isomerase
MFDKVAAAFSVVALGAAGYAVFQTGKMAGTVSQTAAALSAGASGGQTAVVDAAAIEKYMAKNPVSDKVIEAYLRENPEVLMASLERYQVEQRAAQQRKQAQADVDLVASNRKEIFEDGYSFVMGNPDGDITVVEFSDYNCGYCKRAHTAVAEFIEADGNIRLVVKEFPILGPGSTLSGRAALASAMQDDAEKYGPFNDALMRHRGAHNESTIMTIAAKVGLDVEQLEADMKSPEIDKMIKRTFDLAEKLSINGTPAFVIGDQVVRGFVPAAELTRLAELARSS